MKYKPGDKVRIKSLEWYEANKGKYDAVYYCDFPFVKSMSQYCGKELTIDCIFTDKGRSGYIMKETNIDWKFTDSTIEGLADEPQERMVSLEDVCEFLDEHLYTNTSTGDYDYGQEYIRSDFDNATDLIFALRKAMGE